MQWRQMRRIGRAKIEPLMAPGDSKMKINFAIAILFLAPIAVNSQTQPTQVCSPSGGRCLRVLTPAELKTEKAKIRPQADFLDSFIVSPPDFSRSTVPARKSIPRTREGKPDFT